MSLSVFLLRYRLLLSLFLLSLLLHLLALGFLDFRVTRPAAAVADRPLSINLASQSALPESPAPAPAPAQRPEPAPAAKPPPVAVVAKEPEYLIADVPVVTGAATVDTPARPAPPDNRVDPVAQGNPGHYRVQPVRKVRIDYTIDGAEAGSARLDWESDGTAYRLSLDGVLGDMSSEGDIDDNGIAPRETVARRGGVLVTTTFDRSDGATAPGTQDSASVLMQLAGMGLADPDQLEETVSIRIGDAGAGRIERYHLLGEAEVSTPIGVLATLHLARLALPDEPRVELWLAPQHAWLPVQLRVTAPDGAVRTQTLATIEIELAPGPES